MSQFLINLSFQGQFFNILLYYIFGMFRTNMRKASTFKLQAARSKFQKYLDSIETCPVARKCPSYFDNIRESSQAVFEMCYTFHENSPFIHALNYDNKYYGFQSNDNLITFKDYLGDIKQAYLYGDFNCFNKISHKLLQDEQMGKGWFKLQFDLNQYRLDEGSRIMIRVIDLNGKQWNISPPSCYFVHSNFGIFRKYTPKIQHSHRHKISHLLSYTIDLQQLTLKKCLQFIQAQMDLLQCYNTVILKNLFDKTNSPLNKFSLQNSQANLLQQIVQRLSQSNIKVVIEWNFDQLQIKSSKSPLQSQYFKEIEGGKYFQFDLTSEQVLAYFLGSISHYIKFYGIAGIHLTKVHKICNQQNGTLLVKLINTLCERLREDSIILASSKEFIPGLTQPILEGGLGFSFTYNFHQTLSLRQQHQSIYEMVKQIQSSSNCLSISFDSVQKCDYIYLLFTFIISKRGVFTRGPINELREDLVKILKLRKQQQLFKEQCSIQRIDEECMIVRRGNSLVIFNFSDKNIKMELSNLSEHNVVYIQTEQQAKIDGNMLTIGKKNCIMLENQ